MKPPSNAFEWDSKLPRLEGPRLALRWMTSADASDLLSVFGDPEVMRFWSSPAWTDLAEAQAYLVDIQRHFSDRSLFQWGICTRDSEEILGTCTMHQLDFTHRRAELGIILGQASWGMGLGREALEILIGFAFEHLRLHRLEADVDPKNRRSLRLFLRLGFRKEGLLRERWFVHGEIQDTALLGLLKREWIDPA